MITIANANALHIPLPDRSVQCVVTSPPYYGLRDYGTAKWEGGSAECNHIFDRFLTPVSDKQANNSASSSKQARDTCPRCGARRIDAQIGLESTPAAYVANIVAVMREVWRVLKDDGVLFLNLGDSYFGSGRGPTGYNGIGDQVKRQGFESSASVQRAAAYGTSGKALAGYQDRDCLCGNLCDVCRVVYQSRKSHNDNLLASMLTASLSATSREHTESQIGHLPTLDSLNRGGHISSAILDSVNLQRHESERLRAVLASMLGESYPRLLDVCLQRANRDECLLCARSLVDYAQGYADKTQACTCDTAKQEHPLGRSMLGKSSSYVAYPDYTTESLKPKDLCGIPWRVAFALQDAGWYLRQDIIWHKPNPMPESVTDRCTKAHEYVFLLTKRARYYYDAEAIKEQHARAWIPETNNPGKINGESKTQVYGLHPNEKRSGKQLSGFTRYDPSGRNRRSVWTVATQPYSGAHFATFPPALIEPMILAGSRRGDVVLDPFSGSGTTGAVAVKHGRRAVLLDLNTKYIDLQFERTNGVQMTMPV